MLGLFAKEEKLLFPRVNGEKRKVGGKRIACLIPPTEKCTDWRRVAPANGSQIE